MSENDSALPMPPRLVVLPDPPPSETVAKVCDALRDLEAEIGLHTKRIAEAVERIERQLRRIEGGNS